MPGPAIVIVGGIWAYRAYKAYKLAKKLKKAADAVKKAKKAQAATKKLADAKKKAANLKKAKKKDKPCKNCKKKDPCKHLKKGTAGKKHRGGSYGQTGGSKLDKTESHHIPAQSSYPPGSIEPSQMPAVRIDRIDHNDTASRGSGTDAKDYRKAQKKLMQSGNSRKAIADDIKDLRKIARQSGDPKKYNQAIQEMLEYQKCLKQHGLI